MRIPTATALAAAVLILSACSEKNVSYRNDVGPILAVNCNECHAPGKPGYQATGFDTTSHEALLRGGKFGALIKPGDSFTSAFNMVIEGRSTPRSACRTAARSSPIAKFRCLLPG